MRILKVAGINLLLLVSLLFAIEAAFRWHYPDYQYYYRSHPAQPDLSDILAKTDTTWLSPDPELGWVCQQKASLLFPSPPVEGIRYQINREGFRNNFDFTSLGTKHRKRIVLIGDSFTFGIYLPEEQTIASRLQERLGPDYEVISLSVPAWGLDQMYLAYQKYIELLNPDQVIVNFVDDDLMRSLEILFHGCGRKPCLKLENGQLVDNLDNPHWWEYLCWNNQIGNRILLGYHQDKAAKLGRELLKRIISSEALAGRHPIIVRIPALVDLNAKEARPAFSMLDICDAEGVTYLEFYAELTALTKTGYEKLYIPDDGHFTERGTAYYVNKVLPLLQNKPDSPSALAR